MNFSHFFLLWLARFWDLDRVTDIQKYVKKDHWVTTLYVFFWCDFIDIFWVAPKLVLGKMVSFQKVNLPRAVPSKSFNVWVDFLASWPFVGWRFLRVTKIWWKITYMLSGPSVQLKVRQFCYTAQLVFVILSCNWVLIWVTYTLESSTILIYSREHIN